jgi:GH18 family chitinase
MKKLLSTLLFSRRLISLWLIAVSMAFSQTTITSVVDPGGTGQYTSLQAWFNSITSRGANLVSRNVIEAARCICTNGQPDGQAVSTNLTTDSLHYIKIYADTNYSGHNYRHTTGYPSDTARVYRIEFAPPGQDVIEIQTSKVIIDGLCVEAEFPGLSYSGVAINLIDCGQGGTIENCIIWGNNTNTDTTGDPHGHGIRLDAVSKFAKYYIRNNFITGFNNPNYLTTFSPDNCGILTYPVGDSLIAYVDNNTIYNCMMGIWNRCVNGGGYYGGGGVILRNNLFQDPIASIYSQSIYIQGVSNYPVLENNVTLPAVTSGGTIFNSGGFTNGQRAPFNHGDTTAASLAGWPMTSLYFSVGATMSGPLPQIYTGQITGLLPNTIYTLQFQSVYGSGGVFNVQVLENSIGGSQLTAVNTLTTSGYPVNNQSITFETGTNTSVVIAVTAGSGGGAVYLSNFILFTGEFQSPASGYFVNPNAQDFHLLSTSALARGAGINLSTDANDPFNTDINNIVRPSAWDVGASEYGATSDSVSGISIGLDTAASAACIDYAPNDSATMQLERQGPVSLKYLEGYFVSYKVFSLNFFTYFNQDWNLFTGILDSFGNVFMNGNVVEPAFDLPMEAIVTGSPCDSINVVSGIPFTGNAVHDDSVNSIELRSVAGGEAGVAQKIETIIGQGGTSFYARWQMYVPSNYTAYGAPWAYGGSEYQSFMYVIDSLNTHEFYLDFKQDTVNRDNIKVWADTVLYGYPADSASITITRGAAIQFELYYKVGAPIKIWAGPIGSSFSINSPAFSSGFSSTVPLNNELVFGFGWSGRGSSPVYINNITIDSAFIPDNYMSAPLATYLWGNYDQSMASTVLYGGNLPTRGLADSCLTHGTKPILSLGGWPGQFSGLHSSIGAGSTEWTSNTPWNFMMKDSTSSWADYNNTSHTNGLRGHWIYSLINLLAKKKYKGVDFDFEFPGLDTIGLSGRLQSRLFPRLIECVRYAFDTSGHSDWYIGMTTPMFWGPIYPDTAYTPDTTIVGIDTTITWRYSGSLPLASPADTILWGNTCERWYDYHRLYNTIDVMHVMSYVFSGSGDPHNSWNGALWKNPPGLPSTEGNYFNYEMVDSMITARGLPKNKTSIGIGFCGDIWLHNSDLFQPTNHLYSDSTYTWLTILTLGNSDLLYPNSSSGDWTSLKALGASYGWCNTFAQPFYKYHNPGNPVTFTQCGVDSLTGENPAQSDDFIVSYDDSLSTVLKMKWAYNKGYAGVFIWEITQDFEPNSSGVLRPKLEDAMLANLTPFTAPVWWKIYFAKNQYTYDSVLTGRGLSSLPILISPANNSTTGRQPFFSWHSITGASGYDLQAAADTNFTAPVINLLNYQDTVYYSVLNTLDTGTIYYWRVKAVDGSWLGQSFSVYGGSTTLSAVQIGTITSNANGNNFNLTIPWNVYYIADTLNKAIESGLYLNGVYVSGDNSDLLMHSNQQYGSFSVTVPWGNYSVTLVQYNSSGETQVTDSIFTGSALSPVQPDKAGINILSDRGLAIDTAGCEADVIVIQDSTTYNFTFQAIGAYNPDYIFLLKDNSFFSIDSSHGNVLTVNAVRGGLSGLAIKENQTGRVRYIGLAVKDYTGAVPKFPPYVSISNLTQFFTQGQAFYKDIRNGPADDNKRLDAGWYYYYPAYLSNGILDCYIRNSLRFGIQPGFTWYNLSADNAAVDSADMQDTTFLKGYYTELMQLMQYCSSVMKGVPISIGIEPDFIGYMKIDYPNYINLTYPCKISAAYSSGVLTGSDPKYPNNMQGFCESISYVIKKYYPDAITSWAFPMWACTHNSGKGIMHATDAGYFYNSSGNYNNGRSLIMSDYMQLSNISLTLGLNYLTDCLNIEGWGYDGGYDVGEDSAWYYPENTDWFWNDQYWDNLLLAAGTMSAAVTSGGTGMPVILNGNSGHIDHSLMESPSSYHSNNLFPDLGDGISHFEDSAPDYFFGDTIVISGLNRLNYFSAIAVGDTGNVIVKSDTVIWKQHITKALANGVIGISFGPGEVIDTHNTPDPNTLPYNLPSDQYWWMVKAQRYYQNPVMK